MRASNFVAGDTEVAHGSPLCAQQCVIYDGYELGIYSNDIHNGIINIIHNTIRNNNDEYKWAKRTPKLTHGGKPRNSDARVATCALKTSSVNYIAATEDIVFDTLKIRGAQRIFNCFSYGADNVSSWVNRGNANVLLNNLTHEITNITGKCLTTDIK